MHQMQLGKTQSKGEKSDRYGSGSPDKDEDDLPNINNGMNVDLTNSNNNNKTTTMSLIQPTPTIYVLPSTSDNHSEQCQHGIHIQIQHPNNLQLSLLGNQAGQAAKTTSNNLAVSSF